MIETSPDIAELSKSLAAAQAKVKGAAKDSENPFFRSKYADLASIWDACRDALSTNGISVVQSPSTTFSGEPEIYTAKSKSGEDRSGVKVATTVSVVTRLCHASGQWMQGTTAAMLPAADPQAVGSAITYLRRYALAAMVGVAPEDDDGEATSRAVPQTSGVRTNRQGEITLPGKPESWDGFGGKPLTEVPTEVLGKVRSWLKKKDEEKNASLIEAIDNVTESRRAAAEETFDDVPAALRDTPDDLAIDDRLGLRQPAKAGR